MKAAQSTSKHKAFTSPPAKEKTAKSHADKQKEAARQAALDKAIREARIPLPLGVGALQITAPDRTDLATNSTDGFRKIVHYKGDLVLVSKPNQPVKLSSQLLNASCQWAIFTPRNDALLLRADGYSPGIKDSQVKIQAVFRSFRYTANVKIEAECDSARITRGKMELIGNVSGFYEDKTGRYPLKGKEIVFTAFNNAVSIVRDRDLIHTT
jgi:hypothetical protein